MMCESAKCWCSEKKYMTRTTKSNSACYAYSFPALRKKNPYKNFQGQNSLKLSPAHENIYTQRSSFLTDLKQHFKKSTDFDL